MVKKCIMIFVLCSLLSCSTLIEPGQGTIPVELRPFLKDLMANPELVFSIKEKYPELIHDSIYSKGLFSNISLRNFINDFRYLGYTKKNYYDLSFVQMDSNYLNWNPRTKEFIKFSININAIYRTYLRDRNGGIEVFWIYKNKKYYLFDLFGFLNGIRDYKQ